MGIQPSRTEVMLLGAGLANLRDFLEKQPEHLRPRNDDTTPAAAERCIRQLTKELLIFKAVAGGLQNKLDRGVRGNLRWQKLRRLARWCNNNSVRAARFYGAYTARLLGNSITAKEIDRLPEPPANARR